MLPQEQAAREFAIKAHGAQKYGEKPYVAHLDDVHGYATLYYGLPKEVRIAAYLHDTLEDTKMTYEDLEAAFGTKVADLVEAVTGRGPNRKARNKDAYEKIVKAGCNAGFLKLCDRRANSQRSRELATTGDSRLFKLYQSEQDSFARMIETVMKDTSSVWRVMLADIAESLK